MAYRNLSSYYGRATSPNAFPQYSDSDLRRDLERPTLDNATRVAIESELQRRVDARKLKRDRKFCRNFTEPSIYRP